MKWRGSAATRHGRVRRGGAARWAACMVAIALAVPAAGTAQDAVPLRPGTLSLPPAGPLPAPDSTLPRWLPAVASLAVPGAGQILSGQERGAIYLVMEAFLLTRFISFRSEGSRERDRFRELAFTVARGQFTPMKRDTVFEYFEQLERFIESGPFDTDPGPALVPPTDERSFNGSIWALARQTFFTNPDSTPDPDSPAFQRALDFYRRRAIGANFRWSWRNAGLEQDLYRQSIRQSDEAFRRATTQIGLVLANHLLSTIDAIISQRLSSNRRRVDIATLVWAGDSRRLQGLLMVRLGI